jgi:hypothetical protein
MEPKPEEPKPGSPRLVDLNRLANTPGYKLSINTPESPDEIQSRLRRDEREAEHTLRINLIVHVFVIAVVGLAFLASIYIAIFKDPKTGLPDKALGIITAIVAAGVGYMTGKGSK